MSLQNQTNVSELFRYVHIRDAYKEVPPPTLQVDDNAPSTELTDKFLDFAGQGDYAAALLYANEQSALFNWEDIIEALPANTGKVARDIEAIFKAGGTIQDMADPTFQAIVSDENSYNDFRKAWWEKLLLAIFSGVSPLYVVKIGQALTVARVLRLVNLDEEVARMPMVLLHEQIFELLKKKPMEEGILEEVPLALEKSGGPNAIRIGNSVISVKDLCADMSVDPNPCGARTPVPFKLGTNFAAKVFWGDLLVTRQSLVKYEMGEVAHVEAVMKGETKNRSFRRLERSETTEYYEAEQETENERETQTTERFSMERESSRVLNEEMGISSGVNVTASYGTVQLNASLGFNYSTSSTESSREATEYSKDVTSRALDRVKKRIKQSKTVTVIREFEENAEHGFVNTDPASTHINGVYRWLDKVYLNKVYNYGYRMMQEFMVPEPASFYIFRKMHRPQAGEAIAIPIHPRELGDTVPGMLNVANFDVIDESNYKQLAAFYGVPGIMPPPVASFKQGVTVNDDKNPFPEPITRHEASMNRLGSKSYNDFVVPEGYRAVEAAVRAEFFGLTNPADNGYQTLGNHGCVFQIGEKQIWFHLDQPGFTGNRGLLISEAIDIDQGVLPISWNISSTVFMHANIIITFSRKAETLDKWKIETYNAIMDAYNEQLREYNNWLRSQELDYQIQGNNPGLNRRIEREELKKRVIELMSGQRFESFDAAVNGLQMVSGYPEVLFGESREEGKIVKYFEQVYEWENMTYVYYPYFWGRKVNWLTIKQLADESDPLFEQFLQAGYARVVLPVRKGFEDYAKGVCGFMAWMADMNPQYAPGVDAPWFVSIANEIQWQNQTPEEDPDRYVGSYLQRVPTNLVCLAPEDGNNPASLPDFSAEPGIAEYL